MSLARRTILEGWTVKAGRGPVPVGIREAGEVGATVPGAVHTDLLAAGLIEDPYLDDNEKTQAWIGYTDWTYRTDFSWTADGFAHHDLVFAGLDTIAEVRLNGVVLGETRNMHRTYRFDVRSVLRDGTNELVVAFASPVREADAASLTQGYRPHVNHHPYNALRKMACSFGWDWGIDTSTSGIWREVALESWSTGRIAELRLAGDIVDGIPTVRGQVRAVGAVADTTLRLTIAGVEQTFDLTLGGTAKVLLPVPDAAWWWPRGHGEQPLYDVDVEMVRGGEVLDATSRRIGFRVVDVRTQTDVAGVGFAIVINGETVLVRGANWIPDDTFPHRVDRARYARRLAQAEFAGINLLRVWGGGIYESENFYAECDERGILTWQDFLLACAAYAEDEPLGSEVEAEAREAITRLAGHPSLVILNGNNENLWGHQDWDWAKRLDGRTWGAGYYYDLFPRLVAELAPHVAYTPGSPFTPDRDANQNDPTRGTVHIWDLWNEKDWPRYRDYRPRFVSEFGWQGPPTWSTLRRSISDDPLTPESPGMLVHQKASEGNNKLTDGLTAHLRLPNEINDWHWAMSLNQAVAVRTAIEWWRSLTPLCTGTVVWQLNDCWPVTSWAAVDGDGREKPLLHALRQAHAERLLTLQPDGELTATLLNDTADAWSGELVLERHRYEGQLLASSRTQVTVRPRSASHVAVDARVAEPGDAAEELLVARIGEHTAYWFFTEARDSALGEPGLSVRASRSEDGWHVDVAAASLAREVTLLVDRVDPDARVDEALVTLLPGQSAKFHVHGALEASPAAFADPLVLRSMNDLVLAPNPPPLVSATASRSRLAISGLLPQTPGPGLAD